ncbi:MAG: DUF1854 domain-containing protein [Clostridiales bacterium]
MKSDDLTQFNSINYIKPSKIVLKKSLGDFILMKFNFEDEFKLVSFRRCFPLSNENKYISVIDKDENEIGIIKDLDEFSKEIRNLILNDLSIRYFMPKINDILKIKEEGGYYYWEVVTDMGDREFIIKSGEENVNLLKHNMLSIEDIEGNRYCILDYKKLSKKSQKMISIFT